MHAQVSMPGWGSAWQGGMHGQRACMAGGHVWQEACMAGGYMLQEGACVTRGACMARGGACMAGGGHVWQERWPEMVTAAGGTHPTGMHSCFQSSLTTPIPSTFLILMTFSRVPVSKL